MTLAQLKVTLAQLKWPSRNLLWRSRDSHKIDENYSWKLSSPPFDLPSLSLFLRCAFLFTTHHGVVLVLVSCTCMSSMQPTGTRVLLIHPTDHHLLLRPPIGFSLGTTSTVARTPKSPKHSIQPCNCKSLGKHETNISVSDKGGPMCSRNVV